MSSLIRDAIFDYDIQRADGFTITPMASITTDRRWLVQCGESKEIVNIWQSRVIVIPMHRLHNFIKDALQSAVDRMWSRWLAL